jgi:iodotyrosine deiodinase
VRQQPLDFTRLSPDVMAERASARLAHARTRRSVREFSSDPIPLDVVRTAIETAAQAPSGANKQPWTFVLVTDPAVKSAIRVAAEHEEREFYGGRAPNSWLEDLAGLGTDANKPFIEDAPALIVVFAQSYAVDGSKHYYVRESVGLACGMLLGALHEAGLATLTHTPGPMTFLRDLLRRPPNEKAFLLIPVGFPSIDCQVPAITRKPVAEVLVEV